MKRNINSCFDLTRSPGIRPARDHPARTPRSTNLEIAPSTSACQSISPNSRCRANCDPAHQRQIDFQRRERCPDVPQCRSQQLTRHGSSRCARIQASCGEPCDRAPQPSARSIPGRRPTPPPGSGRRFADLPAGFRRWHRRDRTIIQRTRHWVRRWGGAVFDRPKRVARRNCSFDVFEE